ncbi:MAG: hypothetical protein ABIH53_04530 [archaeon]
MLDEKRIREAQTNVKTYLDEGLLKKVTTDQKVMAILIKNSEESINIAKLLFDRKLLPLWTIVCSYYSMYYIANAVLNSRGYKVGDKISHKITADALITYIKNKLEESLVEEYEQEKQQALAITKSEDIIESFDMERIKRGRLQYNTSEQVKYSKAATSLERAKKFIHEMRKLL